MNPSQKKALLGVAIAICMLVAGDKIYSFYKAHTPPAQVGECLSVKDPQIGEVKIHIMSNDNAAAVSEGVAEIEPIPGLKVGVPVRASYEELRDLGATKVSCE